MYFLIKLFLKLLARLPFRALYILADFLFILLYHIIKYRRKVVHENLEFAFPEKTYPERMEIAKKFYRNFSDMFVEIIKMFSTDYDTISSRFEIDNSVYQEISKTHSNILLGGAHQFNWEWANWTLPGNCRYKIFVVYMPVSSGVFENLTFDYREKHGAVMQSIKDLEGSRLQKSPAPSMLVLLADQNPSGLKRSHWVNFFGRKVPFHKGLEIMARRYNFPVIFDEIIKVKRGHYKSKSRLAFLNPKETEPGEITEAYVKFLEESVRRQPENWLWSHRRWKHATIKK